MPEIAVLNRSSRVSDDDLAFIVRAVNLQAERDFAPAWSCEPWPVCHYATLPAKGAHPIAILDDIEAPGALGFHDDQLGAVYGRVLADGGVATTLSHEVLEMTADPEVNLWRKMPSGMETALEVADAVEADVYSVDAELFGEKRSVLVSNFVLPAWFDAGAKGPYDFLGLLKAPFTMSPGGYMILRDNIGNVSNVFAASVGPKYLAKQARKFVDPMSRTYRRLCKS